MDEASVELARSPPTCIFNDPASSNSKFVSSRAEAHICQGAQRPSPVIY